MHILKIPSEEYIPSSSPIAGIFQHDQAKILQRKGHQVGALSFSFNFSFSILIKAILGKKNKRTEHLNVLSATVLIIKKMFSAATFKYEKMDEINVLRCDGFWGLSSSKNPLSRHDLWMKFGEKTLITYVEQYGKPDVIHAHNMIYAGMLALSLKKKFGIPVVITEHSSQYAMEGVHPALNLKLEKAYQDNESILAVSPKLVELLTHKYLKATDDKITCLPNVLDPFIETSPLNRRANSKVVRILNVGNLIPLKGQLELIEAFNQAFKSIHHVELIIAGSGELKEKLQLKIKSLNLEGRVKLIGLIDREEVINQMDHAHIFTLPSHYETFGVVLIEALSRGLPVISTYCGGPESIVNEGNGLLVEPKNVNQLADACLKMYKEHENYNPIRLRAEAITLFGEEAFYNNIISIYRKVIIAE